MLRIVAIILALVVVSGLALWGASSLDQAKNPHRTKLLNQQSGDGTLTVDIKPRERESYIVYCNEEHFREALQHVRKFVKIETDPLTAPGGPMLIALADVVLDEELQKPKRVLIEVLKRHAPTRVVLVAHEECLIYDSIGAWYNDPASVRLRQLEDLWKARRVLREWFPTSTVELYYGAKLGEHQMRFSPVGDEITFSIPDTASPEVRLFGPEQVERSTP